MKTNISFNGCTYEEAGTKVKLTDKVGNTYYGELYTKVDADGFTRCYVKANSALALAKISRFRDEYAKSMGLLNIGWKA